VIPPDGGVTESVIRFDATKDVWVDPPGGRYKFSEFGTPPPICTVTEMVCGASIAPGDDTVTSPVKIPCASELVVRPITTEFPEIDGFSHDTLALALNDNDPVPVLVAITVAVDPFWPTAISRGPMVDVERCNCGVA